MKQPELLEFLDFYDNEFKHMEDIDESIDKGLEDMIDKYMNPENKIFPDPNNKLNKLKLKPISNRSSIRKMDNNKFNSLTISQNKNKEINSKFMNQNSDKNCLYRDKKLNEKEVNLLFEKSLMILKEQNYNIDEINNSNMNENGKLIFSTLIYN